MYDKNNKLIYDQQKILTMQKEFYQELYTAEKNVHFTAVNNTEIKLSYEERQQVEEPISKEEVKVALKQMVQHKTPGMDGLSVTFYKMFFGIMGDSLHDAILEGMEQGKLHRTAQMGVINLIPKAKKDTRRLKNLRPITLCNVDLKIIEKVLANRIKLHIDKLISMEQRGFMANRRIAANIRKILDIIKCAEDQQLDSVILSTDFLKCFDRIEFEGILGLLKFFGYGYNFVNMIRTTYNEFTAVVQNNGHFSETINIHRGVHQGGPNSSFLFLLCAEVLAIQVRSAGVEGIPIGEIIHLLNQYADDMDVSTTAKEQNLKKLFEVFDRCERQIGLKVNYDKTTVYRIGSLRNTDAIFYTKRQLNWTNEPINVLGIWIDHNTEITQELNYRPLIEKTKAILTQWQRRNLSLLGKIMIINTLVASQFVYRMTVLPTINRERIKILEDMFV